MKLTSLVAAAAVFAALGIAADSATEAAQEVLRIERASLDGWLKGNPDPMLASMDSEITYVHIMTEKRLDGLAAVRALVEPYRGRPLYDSYEMADPKTQSGGNVVVLTYVLVQRNGASTRRYHATHVYERKSGAWKVIHSHWSAINAE